MVFVTYLILGLLQAKGIVLDKNSDEWAKNIKRGIASSLQLDLGKIDIKKSNSFVTEEVRLLFITKQFVSLHS